MKTFLIVFLPHDSMSLIHKWDENCANHEAGGGGIEENLMNEKFHECLISDLAVRQAHIEMKIYLIFFRSSESWKRWKVKFFMIVKKFTSRCLGIPREIV
jgi:hypothetical protein